MNRRVFLGASAALAGVLAGTTSLLRRSRVESADELLPVVEGEIRRIVRSRLDYLIIEDPELDAFMNDYAVRLRTVIENRWRRRNRLSRLLYRANRIVLGPLSERDVRRACAEQSMEDRVVISFLSASSFFYNDADESVPVTYRRLNVIHRTCRNPFARFS